jgi:hypothetical protein
MPEIKNQFDPINKILLVAEPLIDLLRSIHDEARWLEANYASAHEPPTQEQLRQFEDRHTKWQKIKRRMDATSLALTHRYFNQRNPISSKNT